MKILTCIVCPNGCTITIDKAGDDFIVSGNMCRRGRDFAINEVTNPKRSVCSTVKTTIDKFPRLPVRTNGEVPMSLIFPVMNEISKVKVEKPVHSGEKIIENVLGTGIDVIAASDIYLVLEEIAQ